MHALYEPVGTLMREVAATIMMPRFRNLAAHEIAEKSPGDLVTIVDHEAEARLADGLAALLPDARILGEEAAAADPALLDDLDAGVLWVIDPLDGTMNFSEGKQPFAIMVALIADGVREAGWILDPVRGRMCHAARGKGTFIDGTRQIARPTGAPRPLAAIGVQFLSPERRADIEVRATGKLDLVAIPRCAGEQYPRLLLAQNDIALFERMMPWDHLAGALMLEEAGGRIARPDGSRYTTQIGGEGMIAAASPELWDQAARVLFG